MKMRFYFVLLFIGILGTSLFAQYDKQILTTEKYLNDHKEKWNLSAEDIADVKVDNAYRTKHNGVTHIYFKQQYKGIEVFNAVFNANLLPNGQVFFTGNRFYSNLATTVNTTKAILSPEEAIRAAASHLKIDAAPSLKEKTVVNKAITYTNTQIANSPITIKLVYQPMQNGQLQLAWQLAIDMIQSVDYWNVRIDALTGDLLDKNNWTRRCAIPNHHHQRDCNYLESTDTPTMPFNSFNNNDGDGASYNVFPVPLESPLYGDRAIVNDPSDPIASPYGWHDIDEAEGAEFTITRGNNVHAYADPADRNRSQGDEPDGGDALIFDPSYDPELEPIGNKDAAVTQLFYMNNVMHDLSYRYGFDEAAGNFQETNYNNAAGKNGDRVIAEAMDDADSGMSDDNASFSSPPDGLNGSMNMFLWNRGGSQAVRITQPEALAGGLEVSRADFGADIDSVAVSGKLAEAFDATSKASFICEKVINPEDVAGKIAVIDRGECFFVEKARNAQEAGAIAVIICNFENTRSGMTAPPDDPGTDITIPLVMITSGDCQTLRQNIDELEISFQISAQADSGPDKLDGDFDNGIVAHEYGHGISIRLSGGGLNSDCLINDEEMGEGWSDFFSLVTSVQTEDTGAKTRGIGNYVLRDGVTGKGIRRFPYSTDMSINPQTYKDVLGTTAPHPLGEVWAGVLWDLYWAMSDTHGWDADLYTGTGGNNMAIQLVIDGLKLQACSPGFIDGRDAILAADMANNGGANQCLIWEVFARRGLGYSSDQGSNETRNDIKEGFDTAPACANIVRIDKQVTPTITAGDTVHVTLTVTNYKDEMVTNVQVTDELPDGATFLSSTASLNPAEEANFLIFSSDDLAVGASQTITYSFVSDAGQASVSQFKDGGEEGNDLWLVIDNDGSSVWELQDAKSNSGDFAWYVPNVDEESDHTLLLDEDITISGTQPALRFFHHHDMAPGLDGGLVELSTDGGSNWIDLAPFFIREGFTGPITYTIFASPNRTGFWGDNGGPNEEFQASYIDLRSFIGETALVRFRYGSEENTGGDTTPYQGWFIDDVEFLDLFTYQTEACVRTSQGDTECALANEGGTIVETGLISAVDNLEDHGLLFKVFPNPVGDYLNISLSNETTDQGTIKLFNANGQVLLQKSLTINPTPQTIPFNVTQLAGGFYFVEVRTATGVAVRKVILE